MVRNASCPKEGLNKGAWTSHEDKLLSDYIRVHGLGKWRSLPTKAGKGSSPSGLKRCGKSCRLRWLNYLRPEIKRGNISDEEEDLIIRLHKLLGNRWSLIAGRLPGRTDNEIKNYWNTCLSKKIFSNSTGPHTPSEAKKLSLEKANMEKQSKAKVNVIRTKANRCTTALFEHQIPKFDMDSSPDALRPITPLDVDFFSDLNGHAAPPLPLNMDVDDLCMAEIIQNSILLQEAKDVCYMTDGSSSEINDLITLANEDNYLRGIYNCGTGDKDLSPFSEENVWDSLVTL